ncbi:hypothetical protein MW887_008863 [Aspergillus wentii]|nr:hypothetical protein MW887_008863 [Aspergillus wentii]
MGFAAGIAALVAVLVFGLVIAIPFISIPSHAIAAILFAQVAENQGLHICSLGIAAGAGAVFAAARIACLLPPSILSLLLIAKPAKDIFLQIMKDGSFPSTVPPQKNLASRLYGKIPKRMENIIFGPAYNVEPEDIELALQHEMDELSMHLDMEPVWFSRPLGLDQGKHYVLVVNNQKYELRNRQHVRYNTDPINFEDCSEEELPVGQSYGHTWRLRNTRTDADTGLFDVLLIGWTNATHEEIDRFCKELIEGWKYRLVLRTKKGGNCQHFIQAIANSIIPTECRALAWSWFQHGSYGPLQKAQYDKMREDILESGKRFIQLRSILAVNPLPLVGAM